MALDHPKRGTNQKRGAYSAPRPDDMLGMSNAAYQQGASHLGGQDGGHGFGHGAQRGCGHGSHGLRSQQQLDRTTAVTAIAKKDMIFAIFIKTLLLFV